LFPDRGTLTPRHRKFKLAPVAVDDEPAVSVSDDLVTSILI